MLAVSGGQLPDFHKPILHIDDGLKCENMTAGFQDYSRNGHYLPEKVVQVTRESMKSFPHNKRVGNYLLGCTIGEGSFAKVKEGMHTLTGEKVAVKVIDKKKAREDNYVRKNLRREGKLLQMVRHENIAQLYEIMETENCYYLVMELCGGGDLMEHICRNKRLEEQEVRRYMRNIISAAHYLHQSGILHRDLKVENLLLSTKNDIKIIDFGLSNNVKVQHSNDGSFKVEEFCVTQCGSPAYAAPELLGNKKYGPQVDVWSIGVNMYAMLTGLLPFTVHPFNIKQLHNKMINGEMNPLPSYLSRECKNLISKLLIPEPNKRITLREAMEHPWLTDDSNKALEAAPFPNRLRTDQLNQDILKHMSCNMDFKISEIIRLVLSNFAHSATATYMLLSQKLARYKAEQKALAESRLVEHRQSVKIQRTEEKKDISEVSKTNSRLAAYQRRRVIRRNPKVIGNARITKILSLDKDNETKQEAQPTKPEVQKEQAYKDMKVNDVEVVGKVAKEHMSNTDLKPTCATKECESTSEKQPKPDGISANADENSDRIVLSSLDKNDASKLKSSKSCSLTQNLKELKPNKSRENKCSKTDIINNVVESSMKSQTRLARPKSTIGCEDLRKVPKYHKENTLTAIYAARPTSPYRLGYRPEPRDTASPSRMRKYSDSRSEGYHSGKSDDVWRPCQLGKATPDSQKSERLPTTQVKQSDPSLWTPSTKDANQLTGLPANLDYSRMSPTFRTRSASPNKRKLSRSSPGVKLLQKREVPTNKIAFSAAPSVGGRVAPSVAKSLDRKFAHVNLPSIGPPLVKRQ